MKVFKNNKGRIRIGTPVWFSVENPGFWGGDTDGILRYDNWKKEFYIETIHSGSLTIDKGYDVYGNTITSKIGISHD